MDVAGLIQVLLCIVERAHAEKLIHRVNKQSVPLVIRQRHEPYIRLISSLLRIDEFDKLIADRTLVDPHIISCFSVAVAVRFPSAVPGHVLQASV